MKTWKKNPTSYLYWNLLMPLTSYLTFTKLIPENLTSSHYLSSNIILVLFSYFFWLLCFSWTWSNDNFSLLSFLPLSDHGTHQSLCNLEPSLWGPKRGILSHTICHLHIFHSFSIDHTLFQSFINLRTRSYIPHSTQQSRVHRLLLDYQFYI